MAKKKNVKTAIDVKQLFAQLKADNLDISTDILVRARSGDGEALYEISKKYRFYKEQIAIKWCRLAVEQNYGYAMYRLADDYHHGICGLSQNHYLAMEWYLRAANRKVFFAYENIGKLFEYGDRCNMTDNKKALEWYYRWNPNSKEVKMLQEEGYKLTKAEKDKTMGELIMESWDVLQAKKKGLKEIREKNSLKTEEERMEEEVSRMQRVMTRQGYDFLTKDHYKMLLGYTKEIPESSKKEYEAYKEKLFSEEKKKKEEQVKQQQPQQQPQQQLPSRKRNRSPSDEVDREYEYDKKDNTLSEDFEEDSDDYTDVSDDDSDISDDYTDLSDDEYEKMVRRPIPKQQTQSKQIQSKQIQSKQNQIKQSQTKQIQVQTKQSQIKQTQVQTKQTQPKLTQAQTKQTPSKPIQKQPQQPKAATSTPKPVNDTKHNHNHSPDKHRSKEEYDSDYEDDLPECTCGRLHREQEQLRNIKKRERERAEALEKEKLNFERELQTIDWLIANSSISKKEESVE